MSSLEAHYFVLSKSLISREVPFRNFKVVMEGTSQFDGRLFRICALARSQTGTSLGLEVKKAAKMTTG
jgi:hypothetical protein